ncbi:ATP-dependent DNA helicase [Frankliniella fusca]|uniref:ATP-dependent DNA helicase n=1 Tax=Frankliniella fusca TaxID=407009 RepID=A0AAE1LV17_9NEOP|nr:ATP-dependent DNA helicase [Frankliniella fusca]
MSFWGQNPNRLGKIMELAVKSTGDSGPNRKRARKDTERGTGKSLLISKITYKLKTLLGSDSFLILAPTGVAATNVNGSTIHSKLHIPAKGAFQSLTGENARKFEIEFHSVKFLLIDEYSMIGTNMLSKIHHRCQQAKQNYEEDYGGLNLILFGDISQLPPTVDPAVYIAVLHQPQEILGKFLFQNFEEIIELTQVMRQRDSVFLNILENISYGNVTESDYNILKTRFFSNLSKTERQNFNDCLLLFSTRDQAKLYNTQKLRDMKLSNNENVPVAVIPAQHNNAQAKQGTDIEANNLKDILYLAIGAKIMLTSNLWTERGLVNGALGEVIDILYKENQTMPEDQPFAVICTFPNYSGPYIDNNNKSVYVDLGKTEFAIGITYVALSRCKCCKDYQLLTFLFYDYN